MISSKPLDIPKPGFDKNGELIIEASPSSSKQDFDFFEGKWNLRNRKLKSRLSNCTDWVEFESTQEMYRVLNGIGNIDNFLATFDGQPFEGMTVRLFLERYCKTIGHCYNQTFGSFATALFINQGKSKLYLAFVGIHISTSRYMVQNGHCIAVIMVIGRPIRQ